MSLTAYRNSQRFEDVRGLSEDEREQVRIDAQDPVLDERPTTRADCANGPRPCPWVGCQHNLFLDVVDGKDGAKGTRIRYNRGRDPLGVPPRQSCALDVAARGESTLKALSKRYGVSREAARLMVLRGTNAMRRALMRDPKLEAGLRPGPERRHLPIVPSDTEIKSGDAIELRRWNTAHSTGGWKGQRDAHFAAQRQGRVKRMGRKSEKRDRVIEWMHANGEATVLDIMRVGGLASQNAAQQMGSNMVKDGIAVRRSKGVYALAGALPPAQDVAPPKPRFKDKAARTVDLKASLEAVDIETLERVARGSQADRVERIVRDLRELAAEKREQASRQSVEADTIESFVAFLEKGAAA